MAEATTKKRRASGPRQSKPVFAVITYKDESGNVVQMDRSRLTIQIERDAGKLLELVTGGNSEASSCVTQVQLPQPAKRNVAAEGSAAPAA